MPVYCFECPKCGAKVEVIRQMRDSDKPELCPRGCLKLTHRPRLATYSHDGNVGVGDCIWKEPLPMRRDLQAERLGSTNMDFNQPILSEAMGVAPSQVAEHRRLHPDIPLTNDGRVILTSHGERKRIMRKLGFFDKDGYS